jgi:hypothetical protein
MIWTSLNQLDPLKAAEQLNKTQTQHHFLECLILRQLGLPLLGVWALTSSELPLAVPDCPT